MKIIYTGFLRFSDVQNRKFPKLARNLERLLDEWAFSNDTTEALTGHEIFEKLLGLVTNKTFYQLYQKSYPYNNTFELKTTQLEPIKVRFYDGGYNEPDAIFVQEGNKEYKYDVICLQEENVLQIRSSEMKELDTGFTQKYSMTEDSFSRKDEKFKMDVTIKNPNGHKCDGLFFLVNDEVKDELIETSFKNAMEIHQFILDKLYPSACTYTIITRDPETDKELEKIVVENGLVKYIKLVHIINGKPITIEQSFEQPNPETSLERKMRPSQE